MASNLCSTLICEGDNDILYFKNILDNPCTVSFPGNQTVLKKVNDSLSNYFKTLDGRRCKMIIISDGGIDQILRYLLPSIISSSVRRYDELSLKILFDDGGNPNALIEGFMRITMNKLCRRAITGKYLHEEIDGWHIVNYFIDDKIESIVKIKILFFPISLETQIVMKSINLYGESFGSEICSELSLMDPHDAIVKISKLLKGESYNPKTDKKYCIELAGRDNWLQEEEWHKLILKEL